MYLLIRFFITPRSKDKDRARSEYIFNILITGLLTLTTVALLQNIILFLTNFNPNNALPPVIMFIFFSVLAFLLFLSRIGHVRIAAYIFIAFLLLSSIYTMVRWGADTPQAWLILSLVIVMSGILLGTKTSIVITTGIWIALLAISYIQIHKILPVSTDWKNEPYTFGDTIVRLATIGILAMLSWLFNQEIEKSLHRAQQSEADLKKERDQLEITVERRTQELRQVQMEKIAQLYRFAEFGKSASGIFHDLANPLNLVSLNLERLSSKNRSQEKAEIEEMLKRAIEGTQRMESFVRAARKQVQNADITQVFDIQQEIVQSIHLLEYKAKSKQIAIEYKPSSEKISITGNPIKFSQIMMNLISNAIDSFEEATTTKRKVIIKNKVQNNKIMITIEDTGKGIDPANIAKIFEPFFTTKSFDTGTGIGLSITKTIIEKDFKGKITVVSRLNSGSTFTVLIPQ
jgi:signal transduction histidine kinase